MNWKKIRIQICICVVLCFAIFFAGKSDNERVANIYQSFMAMAGHNVTSEEFAVFRQECLEKVQIVPARLTSAVIRANKESRYGEPVDESSEGQFKQVHAVAGGMVLQVGKSHEKGIFAVVRHEDAVSTYGQLDSINVVPNERIQRGEIIGTYDTLCGKEFLYELTPNL